MLICPGCKSVLKKVPATGKCPKCGQAVREVGTQTEGAHVPTLEVTQELPPPTQSRKRDDTAEPAATMELPAVGPGRSVSIAPRKLSAKNVAQVTNTWAGAISQESHLHSSLKLDSKSASGGSGGSSLVVNLRGIRSVEESVQPVAGADYELLQVIGKGGMGVVYSARQASVDRMVAVKMIRPNVAADVERREKFLSEAVVTGDLDHPNIVPIYELGSDENNLLFYSMKRVQGTPWSHEIGKKSLGENLEILMKVADAVAFAHANGVLHRDLKPENVMLGDFGEVLVMDWGLALATASFRHAEFVTSPDSMGGTPAYMAPEMVTGPFELMGPTADIYLLGAILFEIVTGLRPHTGTSTQDCLLAAARNDIQPTDKTGELVEIAYRAMATEPADRYASVQEFQAAIRAYQSHMESIALATRAAGELAEARQSGDYQAFSRALFGFQEALAMWSGNARARAGIGEAQLAYAASAKSKGDYELGSSLLDAANPEQAPLRRELEAALTERDARQKWLSRFKRIAAALAVVVFSVISIALVIVYQAKSRETAARQQAETARRQADVARDEAVQSEQVAKDERAKAVAAEKIAKTNEQAAVEARKKEEQQKMIAEAAKQAAEEEREKAVLAKQGEEQAAYVARIGMAAAKIDENAFDTALALLDACQPRDLRHWEWGYLKRLCEQGRDFAAEGSVHAVAFAPDASWFATAGEDRRVQLWDRATGNERLAIEHPAPIAALSVSHDGRLLATGANDGKVRIIRVDDGQTLSELAAHTDRVLAVAFSPGDARLVASASRDTTARVWDTATGQPLCAPLQGHYGPVWSTAFSPDARRLVTAGQDGRVLVWPLAGLSASSPPTIEKEKEFLGHAGAVFATAFSPDGRQIASGGYDRRVLVWEPDVVEEVDRTRLVSLARPLSLQTSRALEGHTAPVRTIAFSPDGQYVVSGSEDNTVRIWDNVRGRAHAQLRGHSRPVLACAISPDAAWIVSGGMEGQIKLWSIVNYKQAPHGQVLVGHDDAIAAAAFSRDSQRVVTASRDHSARIYRADTGQSDKSLAEGHAFLASRAVFFDDGRRLLTAGGDNTVRLWDAATGSQLETIEGTGRTAAVAVSRDGRRILTGKFVRVAPGASEGSGARGEKHDILRAAPQLALWDLDQQRSNVEPHVVADNNFGKGHPALVTAVAISPDGSRLFSGDDAGIGKLWDAATGAELGTLTGHTGGITAAEFIEGGKRLLSASKDGTVSAWEVATLKEATAAPLIAMARGEAREASETPVAAMAVSTDGRTVLTLSEDGPGGQRQSVVRLWSVSGGTLIGELYRGGDILTSVAFAGNGGAALAAGSQASGAGAAGSGLVRRWDLKSARETTAQGGGPFLDFSARGEAVWSAIEAPGGAGVLTVGGNGAALWSAADSERPRVLFKPHSGLTATGFSADGKYVVTGSTDRRLKIWNAETSLAEVQLPIEHKSAITAAAFSPGGDVLLSADAGGTALLWDWRKRQVRHALAHAAAGGQPAPIHGALFSPDGKNVVTAGEDGTLRIWSAAGGEPFDTLEAGSAVHSAAYSADGKHILAGLSNGEAMLFDAATHRALVRFAGHTGPVDSVGLSPDGRRAISGSRDRLVKIWDTGLGDEIAAAGNASAPAGPATGKELLTLRYHDQPVTTAAFSPDGRTVLTASLDGTAVLWPADAWRAKGAE